MEKIYRELLIKEISSRLPYGIKAQVLGWDEEKGEIEVPLKIYSINTDGYVHFETNNYDVNYLAVDVCRLYLRPMSSMTEEEKKDRDNIVEAVYDGAVIDDEFENVIKYVDWLNAHHFDYRGLIGQGLAIEVTEENNPYKKLNL